jgi:hypothetical protein
MSLDTLGTRLAARMIQRLPLGPLRGPVLALLRQERPRDLPERPGPDPTTPQIGPSPARAPSWRMEQQARIAWQRERLGLPREWEPPGEREPSWARERGQERDRGGWER